MNLYEYVATDEGMIRFKASRSLYMEYICLSISWWVRICPEVPQIAKDLGQFVVKTWCKIECKKKGLFRQLFKRFIILDQRKLLPALKTQKDFNKKIILWVNSWICLKVWYEHGKIFGRVTKNWVSIHGEKWWKTWYILFRQLFTDLL